MAKKNEVGNTGELIAYRRSLRMKARLLALIPAGALALVYALYVAFAYLSQGAAYNLPYFSLSDSLTDFSSSQVVFRWLVFAGVLVIVLAAYFATDALLSASFGRKAFAAHEVALGKILVANHRIASVKLAGKSPASEDDVLTQIGLTRAVKSACYTLSTDLISFDVSQYSYVFEGQERHGVLAVTELNQSKIAGFAQFRTLGAPSFTEFDGREISLYGLRKDTLAGAYVLYTTLSKPEAEALADNDFMEKLSRLKRIATTGVVVTLCNTTLSVLIDGFCLRIGRTLDERIDNGLLEKQADAVDTLYEAFLGLTRCSSILPRDTPLVDTPMGTQIPLETAKAD